MISRKEFIVSQGATCQNWQWSWSFINRPEKVIIFGAWDINTKGNWTLIFSEGWKENAEGRRNAGYKQSREHIRLIEEDDFELYTFPMKYSTDRKDSHGIGPAKIDSFEPILTKQSLIHIGRNWYASDGGLINQLPEEIIQPSRFVEGASKKISINSYERDSRARQACIDYHGYLCSVCSFDFEAFYGKIGAQYIQVHHIKPLSEINAEYQVDPINELVPVCPNCHAMIHRTRPALTVEQLKEYLGKSVPKEDGC